MLVQSSKHGLGAQADLGVLRILRISNNGKLCNGLLNASRLQLMAQLGRRLANQWDAVLFAQGGAAAISCTGTA